jgi:Rps23 Pro-64 3,4-dihydroxylase Tpa1-like proline 4-hydroxylase
MENQQYVNIGLTKTRNRNPIMENLISKIQVSKAENYPFSHVVIKDFLQEEFLIALRNDLSVLEGSGNFRKYETQYGVKKEWKTFPNELESLSKFTQFMSSERFIGVIAKQLGLENSDQLTPDPTYDGGGYVISPPGSFLGYHADFNFSSAADKYRVMNVLFYMNENYQIDQGGHLHLLDVDSKTVEKTVLPIENTLLAFATDDVSFHGVSKNNGLFRKSFNFYYYSDQPLSPNQAIEPHRTLWVSPDEHEH